MEEKMNQKITELKEIIKLITYNHTESEINLLTIALLSMIMLDDEIEDLLLEVLNKVPIYFTKDPLIDTYKRMVHNGVNRNILSNLKYDTSAYFGFSINDSELIDNRFMIISLEGPLWLILDNLIHELKHAVNELITKYECLHKETYFYSGLALAGQKSILYEGIDEAFNSYLVKIYLKNIRLIKDLPIEDEEIRELLNHFSIPSNYHYTYEKIVSECLPLFQSSKFFKLFYYGALYKDFNNLDEYLYKLFNNSLTSTEFFLKLDRYLKERSRTLELPKLVGKDLKSRVRINPYLK